MPPRKLDTLPVSYERSFDGQGWPDATTAIGMRAFQIAIALTTVADAIDKDGRALLRDPISSSIELGGDLHRSSTALGKLPADVDRVPGNVDYLSAEDREAVYEDLVQLVEAKRDETRRRAGGG